MAVYAGLALEEVIEQYNPRAAVPEYEGWLARWSELSAAARKQLEGHLDVPYGPGPAQRLDVFPAARAGAPVNIFVHGGFWRFLDKADHTLASLPIVGAGYASVQVNYDLCPSVDLATVVHEVRQAVAWVHENASTFNADAEKIYVSGHSAGAHLCAMTAMAGWPRRYGLPDDVVKGVGIVSALFDLEPMLHIPGGEDLGLSAQTFRELSPMFLTPSPDLDYLVAVGAQETAQWRRQTRDMCAGLRQAGVAPSEIELAGEHHYSILLAMADQTSAIGEALLAQMAR